MEIVLEPRFEQRLEAVAAGMGLNSADYIAQALAKQVNIDEEQTGYARSVAEKVREYAPKHALDGITLAVLESGIRNHEGFWYVPYQLERETRSRYALYEMLAELEIALADEENMRVHFVPATPEVAP